MSASAPSLFLQSVRAPTAWAEVDGTTAAIARARIFEAMAHVVAERGYSQATIADIVETAGISRRTFYEHFRDKEECFLATYRTGCENGLAQIRAAELESAGDWREYLRRSIERFVGVLAAEPHFARVLLIEVLGAGPRALTAREEILVQFVERFRVLHDLARSEEPQLGEVPDEHLRALVGGTAELVQQVLIRRGEREIPRALRGLAPTLTAFAEAVLAGGR